MLTQSLNTSVTVDQGCSGRLPKPDQFCALTGHAGLVATEFFYRKDEEIYGEDEPAEYVYQVIRGAVRTYKLFPTDAARSARFICRATSSGSNRERTIASRRKPSSIPPCGW